MSSGSGRTVLEWHMEQHDSSLIGALCLDHIALPPQPGHSMMNTHIDFASDDPSTDGEMDVSFLASRLMLQLLPCS